MNNPKISILLSGTRRGLESYWYAAGEALSHAFPDLEIHSMENLEPEDIPSDHWSRREGSIAGVLIGLVGRRYGFVPANESRSVTEQEYDIAAQVGIERLMFLTDADAELAQEEDNLAHQRVQALREKISLNVRQEVLTAEAFAKHAIEAVRRWEGRTLRGASQGVEAYFGPMLQPDALLSHTEALVGQQTTLQRVRDFVASTKRIAVLHAPWGRGKSRLLLAVGHDPETLRRAEAIRFARDREPLTRQHLEISAGDPMLLVVDDAHVQTDQRLLPLLAFLRRCGPRVKLLLVSRTSSLPALDAEIRSMSIPMEEVEHFDLPALSHPEQHHLITTSLGWSNELSNQLALRTLGSPLAGLLAARLVKRGVTFDGIEKAPDFVSEVIGRFEDALLTLPGLDMTAQGHLRQLLRLIALCGPLNPGDPEQRDALARFLGLQPEDLLDRLGMLESAGLITRSLRQVSIPAHGIRESVAARGCINEHGEITGLAERALKELFGPFRENLLRTLAQVDAAREGGAGAIDFLQSVWPMLRSEFVAAPDGRRIGLVSELVDVAPHRPAEITQFARFALSTGLVAPHDNRGLSFRPPPIHVLHDSLTAMLRGMLHRPEFVPNACDLLWEMAKNDARPAAQHPECAERALLDLAGYEPFRPVACSDAFLGWIERRIAAGDIPEHRLVAYLRPLLAKELDRHFADGASMTFWVDPLPLEKAKPVHEKAMSLLERLAETTEVPASAAAIAALSVETLPPAGGYGRGPSVDELAQWEPVQLDAVTRLRAFSDSRKSAVADLLVLKNLRNAMRPHVQPRVRGAAAALQQEILGRQADSIELVLMPGSGPPWGPAKGSFAAHEAQVRAIATLWRRRNQPPEDLARMISAAWSVMAEAGLQPNAAVFLQTYAPLDLPFADWFLTTLIRDDHPVARDSYAVFEAMRTALPERWRDLVEQAVLRDGPNIQFAAAIGLSQEPWRSALGEERPRDYWKQLLRSTDVQVRGAVLRSLGTSADVALAIRVGLLLGHDPASDGTHDDWLIAVGGLYPQLSTQERQILLTTLQRFESFDYFAEELLARLSVDEPAGVIDLLIARIANATSAPSYSALPDTGSPDCLDPLPQDERVRGLLLLGDLMRHESVPVRWAANKLFARLGGHDTLRATRTAWVNSGQADAIQEAARSFRAQDPYSLFVEDDVIVGILRAAERAGADMEAAVTADLLLVAALGGVDGPEFDEGIERKARSVASNYVAESPEGRFFRAVAEQGKQRAAQWRS